MGRNQRMIDVEKVSHECHSNPAEDMVQQTHIFHLSTHLINQQCRLKSFYKFNVVTYFFSWNSIYRQYRYLRWCEMGKVQTRVNSTKLLARNEIKSNTDCIYYSLKHLVANTVRETTAFKFMANLIHQSTFRYFTIIIANGPLCIFPVFSSIPPWNILVSSIKL